MKKIIAALVLIVICTAGYFAYQIFRPNITIPDGDSAYFYIPTGSSYEDVINNLDNKDYIRNRNILEWVAEKKNYKNHVKPGRYKLKHGMNNNELIDLLRSGNQEPIKLTINNIRTKEELDKLVSGKLEANEDQLLVALNDPAYTGKYGFNPHTISTMFIPNTYEFNWNTSADEFIQRMANEYKKFWNDSRKSKAKKLGLSQSEVTILASIVQAEQTVRASERPKVAGLYVNRIRKKMRLESDPTIIFAIGDFTIQRVLNKDREVDSPYNTYKYRGLPPGPINIPAISSIDAVLNHEKHDYIFMCAKEDFSGYHNFAKTYAQHQIYARKYRRELNKRKIYR